MREVCGLNVIVAYGKENINFTKVINMNESAAFLWQGVVGKDFDVQTLADLLCEAYEVSRDTAVADADALLKEWVEAGLVE